MPLNSEYALNKSKEDVRTTINKLQDTIFLKNIGLGGLTNIRENPDRYKTDIIAELNGTEILIEVKHFSKFFAVNEFNTDEPNYFAIVNRKSGQVMFYSINEFKKEWINVGIDNYTHRTIYVNKKDMPLSIELKKYIEGTCRHNKGINWKY